MSKQSHDDDGEPLVESESDGFWVENKHDETSQLEADLEEDEFFLQSPEFPKGHRLTETIKKP